MLLSDSYKYRLQQLAGIVEVLEILAEDRYPNSDKRIRFDMNVMKQAIEGGLEVGMIFKSNNDKYTMPTWKMRLIHPVAMGYDKKGQLVIRGIHVIGQSEKKALETGIRTAEAENEWRLFKAANVSTMFLTGNVFNKLSLAGYNPNDSAMTRVIAKFDPKKALAYQQNMNATKEKAAQEPIKPAKAEPQKPTSKQTPQQNKGKEDAEKLQKKIDKLDKLL
jgi:hypothetical protein